MLKILQLVCLIIILKNKERFIIKIVQLQSELEGMNNNEVFNLRYKKNKLEVLKGKLEKLIDSFLSSSGTM